MRGSYIWLMEPLALGISRYLNFIWAGMRNKKKGALDNSEQIAARDFTPLTFITPKHIKNYAFNHEADFN